MGTALGKSAFLDGQVTKQSTQRPSEMVRVMVGILVAVLHSDVSGSIVKPKRIKNKNSTAGTTKTPPNIELSSKPTKAAAAAAGELNAPLLGRVINTLLHHAIKKIAIKQSEIKPHSHRICRAAL